MFQDDDLTVLVRLVTELFRHRERQSELVLRIPILQFPGSLDKIRSAEGHQINAPLHPADPLRRLLLIHHFPFPSLPIWTLLLLVPKLGYLNPRRGAIT